MSRSKERNDPPGTPRWFKIVTALDTLGGAGSLVGGEIIHNTDLRLIGAGMLLAAVAAGTVILDRADPVAHPPAIVDLGEPQ